MSVEKDVSYSGQGRVSSIGGQIRLEQGSGRLVIYDPKTQTERVVHDVSGSHYKDDQGRDMTLVNTLGITTIDPTNNISRGRWGIAGQDGRPFGGFTKPGVDIKTEID